MEQATAKVAVDVTLATSAAGGGAGTMREVAAKCGAVAGFTALLVAFGAAIAWQASAQSPSDRPRASMMPVQSGPSEAGAVEAPQVSVPAVVLVAPGSEVPMPVEVAPTDLAARGLIARIRGLPSDVTLSAGHRVAPGSWAVPVAALKGLRVSVPAGVAGKSDVTIALASIDGDIVAETRTAFVVAAAGLIAPGPAVSSRPAPIPSPPAVSPPTPAPPAPPRQMQPAPSAMIPPRQPPAVSPPSPEITRPTPADRQRAEGFLSRGKAMLAEGNIVAARLFLERAADAGLAEAALLIGETFDPRELRRLGAQGIAADPARARSWYEKAQQLGSELARQRLEALAR